MPMKHTTFILLLSAIVIGGCSKSTSTSKKDNDSYTNPYCAINPLLCNGGTTTGTTTGGTTSGTTGGTSGGGNYTTIPSDNNWQSFYPTGEPTGSCSSPTGSGYPLRKGTVTVAGGQMYSPGNPWYSMGDEYSAYGYSHNTSYFLTTVNEAKAFLDADSVLKVRVKPRPQPKPPTNKTWCFGRTFASPDTYGYTSLKYNVSVRPVNADGSLGAFMGTASRTTSVNSCSTPIDFSSYISSAPNGLVVVIHDVQSLHCWYSQGCTYYEQERSKHCWQMDIEVAVDGTQSI